ncbi:hypothetical protein CHLNCDRAFT_141905 [Chlorella variabilis]|uniref:glycine--tRNA ligase n=1 Tax=Chlorella variabilis TaxID=554065 RepID=E1Z7B1_CHLVA|nr:hypothetical protein CHLNCDRAFT_141905 [Chlorella variabilis]EFN58140.1 hypothetical protein CHLNCDRAFT_141905 [Chlorella variabilis]|eukprot:XP_005850242.1 hypothetical protein CHLNCDRAFT_141905 [Chlorella variabilis]
MRLSGLALPRATAVEAPTASTPASNGGPRAPAGVPTFQEAISRLQQYWAGVGCALWLPHNTEVGAGTMNPATFLRVLGPEPWSVAYAEPSVRPDDSRYGDNPNRVQRHTQFQVILKPDPGNPQELYLGSLAALGVDTRAHDVRFVEDNWESPVLGAWGLGWEGAKHFKDIQYSQGVSYGEMFLQSEYEMSVYNLDEADVEGQRQRFELYDQEARRMLAKRLPVPAYDHLLKLSHTFNLLDARGAVGVTERANCFATMRSLAREVTGLWLARREEQGYPLGVVPPPEEPPAQAAAPAVDVPATFVLEVGSEELPPDDVVSALQQLKDRVPALLDRLRLGHGGVTVEGTPRRLAVLVHELAARQSNSSERVRGPPAKVAYDAAGTPSPALLGFCKKNGVTVEDCFAEVDGKGVEYVWAEVKQMGRPAAEVLLEELPALLASLSFKKSMRWRSDTAYSRPLRWLLALHGEAAVPFTYACLQAGATTRLLRNADQPEQQVASADAYLSVLQQGRISLGLEARKESIWQAVTAAAEGVGGVVPDGTRGDLLEEVANLVESPTVLLGAFDAAFLVLPREVLVLVMRKHQRYFPVYKHQSDELLPYFVTVANGEVDVPTVQAGNEAVLRARFEDAQFFYNNDLATPLADARPRLAGTMFQKDLGSLLDKSARVEQLVPALGAAAGLQDAVPVAVQAAHLCKADLATSMVTEMTALAGTMGRHYALKEGLPAGEPGGRGGWLPPGAGAGLRPGPEPGSAAAANVAEAIFESVLPRSAGDRLPQTPAGLLVSVADKLDSLVGLFAAGCAPTATADPYGLRRAAVGLLQALLAGGTRLDLGTAVAAAAAVQPCAVTPHSQAAVVEFVERRLEQLLSDAGVQVQIEAVRAALRERGRDAALAARTAREIRVGMPGAGAGAGPADEMAAGEAGRLHQVMAALARPVRLTRGKQIDAGWTVQEELFEQEEERALHAAYRQAAAQVTPDMPVPAFLAAAEPLIAPLDAFFDKVFVMCEEQAVRQNRLALLRDVAALPAGILDLAELPGF